MIKRQDINNLTSIYNTLLMIYRYHLPQEEKFLQFLNNVTVVINNTTFMSRMGAANNVVNELI